MSHFTGRHLNPASRLNEILFGFIMVLTVTLTASFSVAEGKKGAQQLLLAAIDSNVAWWGYRCEHVYHERHGYSPRQDMISRGVQRASNPEAALGVVKDRVEPELQGLLGPERAEAFSKSVLPHCCGTH